jgi:hypothetical protein
MLTSIIANVSYQDPLGGIFMKKITTLALAFVMCMSFGTVAFASDGSIDSNPSDNFPVLDDTVDYSTSGNETYTYEGDYYIQSYETTAEEGYLGDMLQDLHTHPSLARHFSLTPHSHSIRNITTGTKKSYYWMPTPVWTRNASSSYQNSNDWPTVAWETNQSSIQSASVSTSVGVTDSVVSASVGAEYTKSHTVGTSTTRTYKVPYKKDGRIKVTFDRPYKTFTCVTKYVIAGPPLVQWEETGTGNALGAPYNIVCNIETRNI